MTTATLDRAATPSRTEGRYGFRTVAQMEWLKLRSVRSTWWTLLVFAVGMVGLARVRPAPLLVGFGIVVSTLLLFSVYYVRTNISRRRREPDNPLGFPRVEI